MTNTGTKVAITVVALVLTSAAWADSVWFEPAEGAVYNADLDRYEVATGNTVTINIIADIDVEALDIGAITVDNSGTSIPNNGVDAVGMLNTRLTYRTPYSAGTHKDGTKSNIVIFQIAGGNNLDDPATPVNEDLPVPAGQVLYSFEVRAGTEGTSITIDDLIGPPPINPYGGYPLGTMFTFGEMSHHFDIEPLQLFVVSQTTCSCPGDLNADRQIDLEDLQAVAQILLEAGSPFILPVEPGHCGDLNTDAQIDLEDLQAVAALLLQAGSPFIVVCE